MGNSDSSHHGQAEPAPAPAPAPAAVPAQLKMTAGEIVKRLPGLSPGLSQALLRVLQGKCSDKGVVQLDVTGSKVKEMLEQVCKHFGAELEAAVAAVEEGSSSDVILQLSFCLLLALAPSLPNAREIQIGGVSDRYWYGGEQAVEVLYSALGSQHWSNAVRRLVIWDHNVFGTDKGCEHLAHLLQSGHCKLQQLSMWGTSTGAGGMRHIARALETNSSLTELSIDYCLEVGDGGVEQLAAMLRSNSTLEKLVLKKIRMTTHGLGHLCDALSTQQSLPATSSSPIGTMPNGHMGGLKKLDISETETEISLSDMAAPPIGEGGAALLGAMLANNRCLRTLIAYKCSLVGEDGEGHLAKGLRENSTLEELDISDNSLGKVALGLLVRCLATNNTSLKTLDVSRVGKMPAAEELADMITHNRSLVKLGLKDASYDAGEWATVILPALGRNKTLQSINLKGSRGIEGQQVRDALLDLLRINTTIQEMRMNRTPLYNQGKLAAVEEDLRRNKEFRHKLHAVPATGPAQAMPAAAGGTSSKRPRSCRIVLCGREYAGKSTLFQAMKHLHGNQGETTDSRVPLNRGRASDYDLELDKRTRGISIHLLKDDPEDIRLSVWDFAGHREFHALHDFMFPSGNNATATQFVLAFNPMLSPVDLQGKPARASEIKSIQRLNDELLYWLRFIASNAKPSGSSAAKPCVVVVITHKDRLQAKLRRMAELDWTSKAEAVVERLAEEFSGLLNVSHELFLVNALDMEDADLKQWVAESESALRKMLEGSGVEAEPEICSQVVALLAQTAPDSPIISIREFAELCASLDERLGGDGEGWRVIAKYLKDVGEVMYHDDLDFIVKNPRWFAHGVLGHLLDLFSSRSAKNPRWSAHGVMGHLLGLFSSSNADPGESSDHYVPVGGFLSNRVLSKLLGEAMKSVPGLTPQGMQPEQLIKLMNAMDLCYPTRHPGSGYLLPALFPDEGNRAAEGKRPLTWEDWKAASFIFAGWRLECADSHRTVLTDGFFPRLQVVLQKQAFAHEWVERFDTKSCILEKNLFRIGIQPMHGMEIMVEHSGLSGYFVDILVKSAKSHEKTKKFVEDNFLSTITGFCASAEGCPGVDLRHAIIRPACLRGPGPLVCAYREKQAVAVEKLKKLKMDQAYSWQEVRDESGAVVLPAGADFPAVLLEGHQHVVESSEVGDDADQCYPDTNVLQGKRRGLAVLISMETSDPDSGIPSRPGGSVDRGRLESVAASLHLTLEGHIYVDYPADEIVEAMEIVAKEKIVPEDECFVCFVNGHGGTTPEGSHFIEDGEGNRFALLEHIVNPFRECRYLFDKPKIFFINSCRGQLGLTNDSHDSGQESGVEQQQQQQSARRGEGQEMEYVKIYKDCLIVFSTSEHFVSARDETYGTEFAFALMKAFHRQRKRTDVLTIVQNVVHDVANVEHGGEKDDLGKVTRTYGQVPVFQSTLTKRLYWRQA